MFSSKQQKERKNENEKREMLERNKKKVSEKINPSEEDRSTMKQAASISPEEDRSTMKQAAVEIESNVDTETPIEIQGNFNKKYTNKKIIDFHDDNSYVFSLNRNCSISYDIGIDDEGNHKITIHYFTCAPFTPLLDSEHSDDNSSTKGSGALMLLELLRFLVTQGLNGYKYKGDDYVYLDPEPIRDERYNDRSMEDLYRYYHSLNFEMAGSNTMRATIKAINASERIRGEEGVINTFKKLTKPPDSAGEGGRRKLTKKKRTRRKSRKTRKTKRRR